MCFIEYTQQGRFSNCILLAVCISIGVALHSTSYGFQMIPAKDDIYNKASVFNDNVKQSQNAGDTPI